VSKQRIELQELLVKRYAWFGILESRKDDTNLVSLKKKFKFMRNLIRYLKLDIPHRYITKELMRTSSSVEDFQQMSEP